MVEVSAFRTTIKKTACLFATRFSSIDSQAYTFDILLADAVPLLQLPHPHYRLQLRALVKDEAQVAHGCKATGTT